MSSAVVLDTNIIIALLDQGDALHHRAYDLVSKLKATRVIGTLRSFFESGAVRWVSEELGPRWPDVFEIVEDSAGSLNANDAFIVALQRAGVIGLVATFDEKLGAHPGFRRYVHQAS